MQANTMPTDTEALASASGDAPVGALIAGRSIQGAAVFSPAGDDLGTIDDVMIDATTGRVAYAVLQFGGFLGIGSDYYPIPFGRLRYDATRQGYVSDITKEDIENAPRAEDTWRDDRDWQARNYDHYGVMPYWI